MLWDGLKKSAMYNQDWLFCWCLQVRMKGLVHLDKAFDDVGFPAQKCSTFGDASRNLVGIHHSSPKHVRALWREYKREAEHEANYTIGRHNPAHTSQCRVDRNGNPAERPPAHERRQLARPKGSSAARCARELANATVRKSHPKCTSHVSWLRRHPEQATCYGRTGRRNCDGFQIDPSDTCTLQYYLYCEQLFKGSVAESWCPSPHGYPEHCCYRQALMDLETGHKSRRQPHEFVMQVFPDHPSYGEEKE